MSVALLRFSPGHRPLLQFSTVKFTLAALFLLSGVAYGGLESYSSLVVADQNANAPVPANAIRVTYLGVNGFQFETHRHALLVDPYFTRIGFWDAALNERIQSSPDRVTEGMKHLRAHPDAVLVTHAHFDHLLDVPDIMHRTGARLFSGPTAVRLVRSLGVPGRKCEIVQPGSVRTIGPWTIHVYAAQHDRLFGKVPFAQCSQAGVEATSPSGGGGRGASGQGGTLLKKPVKASDWCVGEPLAFVIEAAGKRIYIDSGGVPGAPLGPGIKHVDLAILGVALPDSQRRIAEVVRRLHPRYTLPAHQDDFFAPLDRGFVFGKMTSFPTLIRDYQKEQLPGRLILLDYFRPWTLR
jgi:L-ascorbate metabolism protein UlaG (beta-lactamase superfamily)